MGNFLNGARGEQQRSVIDRIDNIRNFYSLCPENMVPSRNTPEVTPVHYPRISMVILCLVTGLYSTSLFATALDDYIQFQSPDYCYHLEQSFEVDRTLWEHWLIVVIPDDAD
jgi:hypothetical protein